MKFKDNEMIWKRYQVNESFRDMDEGFGDLDEDLGNDIDNEQSIEVLSFEPIDHVEEVDDDSDLDVEVYISIKKLSEYSKRILDMCKECELEPWMQAQLVKASTYVCDVYDQLDAKADFANSGVDQYDDIDL